MYASLILLEIHTHQFAGQDTLKIARSIAEDDKHHILALDAKTMNPTGNLDTLSSGCDSLSDFDLFSCT